MFIADDALAVCVVLVSLVRAHKAGRLMAFFQMLLAVVQDMPYTQISQCGHCQAVALVVHVHAYEGVFLSVRINLARRALLQQHFVVA